MITKIDLSNNNLSFIKKGGIYFDKIENRNDYFLFIKNSNYLIVRENKIKELINV